MRLPPELRGPDLRVGASYESVGGVIFLVLEPLRLPYRAWRVLTLRGAHGGPEDGSSWNLNEDSGYHQHATPL